MLFLKVTPAGSSFVPMETSSIKEHTLCPDVLARFSAYPIKGLCLLLVASRHIKLKEVVVTQSSE